MAGNRQQNTGLMLVATNVVKVGGTASVLIVIGLIVLMNWDQKLSANLAALLSAAAGGLLSGALTLLGVLYSLQLANNDSNERRRKERDEALRRESNHRRLLHAEIQSNLDVMRHYSQPGRLRDISLLIWEQLNVNLEWMDTKTFNDVFNMYRVFREVKDFSSKEYPNETICKIFMEKWYNNIAKFESESKTLHVETK